MDEKRTVPGFKCTSCGGTEAVQEGEYAKCRFCGVYQKLDRHNDAVFETLQLAAENRQDTEFDKAQTRYDRVISESKDPSALEAAYFGKFLCEQRVLFYNNEAGVAIPSFWQIKDGNCIESKNYKKALEYGEKGKSWNLEAYREQATRIEEYKEKYRKIKKEDYDIFICFKNNDKARNMGYKLYNQFSKNYKVFFSPESLIGTNGLDYEPYIYNALKSARVMLLLCSSEEDLNSQWVRNEWWRYYHFSKDKNSDHDWTLTPIFMDGFQTSYLPEDIKNCNGYPEGIELMQTLQVHLEKLLQDGGRKPIVVTAFDEKLDRIERQWQVDHSDAVKNEIEELIKNGIESTHYNDKVKALLLRARMFSDDYKNLNNAIAKRSIEDAEDIARNHKDRVTLGLIDEYKRYRSAVRKKKAVKTLIALLIVAALLAGGFGAYQYMQDPVEEIYITGKPTSVELEYGEGILSEITSLTTVTRKGREAEVEITNAMISGFDSTQIGAQDVVITYNGTEIHISVNVNRYTLSTPTGLDFSNGQITWSGVQKAQSYTLRINEQIVENVQATSYDDFDFEESGVYMIQVKAVADKTVGMDSAYTQTITVVKLAQVSGLQRDGLVLTWDGVSDCNSYEIYINDDKVGVAAATTYTLSIDQLSVGENLVYVVPADGSNIRFKDELTEEEILNCDHNGEISVQVTKLAHASNLERDGLKLSWDKINGATAYEIHINGEKIATTASTTYTLSGEQLSTGENLIYVVSTGAENLKLREDLTDAEIANGNHNGELTIYLYRQVSGLTWDSGRLSWDAITDATYAIYVNDELVARTQSNSYDLEITLDAGRNKIHVVAENASNITDNSGSDYENNGTVYITKLAQAQNLAISNKKLTWDAVEGASGYEVYCNGSLVATVNATSYDVVIDNSKASNDTYSVRACGDENVLPSEISQETVSIGCLATPTGVTVVDSVLQWSAVSGAVGYQVYVDDTLMYTVDESTLSVSLLGKLEKGSYALSVLAVGNDSYLLSSAKSESVSYVVSETIIYITSEEELKNMALDVSAVYVLGNDIVLTGEWTPIGTTANPFTGRFSGNGHTISGLSVTASSSQGTGLFGVIGTSGIVEDLIIKDATSNGGSSYGAVGIVAGINNGTVRNVTVYGTVSAQNSDNVGGIVGRNVGTIYDCASYASVTGKRWVGGIAGKCEVTSFGVSIYGCTNYGQVQGTSYTGGVMGYITVSKKIDIYDMCNEGTVTASSKYAGGVFGYITGSSGQTATLSSCSNTGNITADDYAAGCFAYVGSYVTVTTSNINDASLNCTNSGTVSAVSGSNQADVYIAGT